MYGRYKDRGLVVMAFPCNQFGQQEPDSEAVIQKYVQENFGVTFPMFSKVCVRRRTDIDGTFASELEAWNCTTKWMQSLGGKRR